jgi:hypothetical protein
MKPGFFGAQYAPETRAAAEQSKSPLLGEGPVARPPAASAATTRTAIPVRSGRNS